MVCESPQRALDLPLELLDLSCTHMPQEAPHGRQATVRFPSQPSNSRYWGSTTQTVYDADSVTHSVDSGLPPLLFSPSWNLVQTWRNWGSLCLQKCYTVGVMETRHSCLPLPARESLLTATWPGLCKPLLGLKWGHQLSEILVICKMGPSYLFCVTVQRSGDKRQ